MERCSTRPLVRDEDIYEIMLTHFESPEPDFGEYTVGMELLKKEIIEQDKMYTVVNEDGTYVSAQYDFPYRFLGQVEIDMGYDKKMETPDGELVSIPVGPDNFFSMKDKINWPSQSERYYYHGNIKYPNIFEGEEPWPVATKDEPSKKVRKHPVFNRYGEDIREFNDLRKDEPTVSYGEKYYANPGRNSTIYLGETTVLKHGAAHPFSTFLASKEGLSPTLLSWGYGDKGTYWIETVKADMDLGEYFITQIKDNLPDISKKQSLTHSEYLRYSEFMQKLISEITPGLDLIDDATSMWGKYKMYQVDRKLDNFVMDSGVVKMIDCEGLFPEEYSDEQYRSYREEPRLFYTDRLGLSFTSGNSFTDAIVEIHLGYRLRF